jgi:hypothetical protein
MTISDLCKLTDLDTKRWQNAILIIAGGFEDRVSAFLKTISSTGVRLQKVCIIEYTNNIINSSRRHEILELVTKISSDYVELEIDKVTDLSKILFSHEVKSVIVDISAMSHLFVFQILNTIKGCGIMVDIVYFEAQRYSPERDFYDRLTDDGRLDNSQAFAKYIELDDSEILYSRDCFLQQKLEFTGAMEPSKPIYLVAFLPFRRARLQLVLEELDVEDRFFVIGQPARDDLRWREQLLEVENFDSLEGAVVAKISTLDWRETFNILCKGPGDVNKRGRNNVVLVPLGSKLQTVSCFAFWIHHQDVGIVFSQPKTYYHEKYSSGWGTGYVIPDFFKAITRTI